MERAAVFVFQKLFSLAFGYAQLLILHLTASRPPYPSANALQLIFDANFHFEAVLRTSKVLSQESLWETLFPRFPGKYRARLHTIVSTQQSLAHAAVWGTVEQRATANEECVRELCSNGQWRNCNYAPFFPNSVEGTRLEFRTGYHCDPSIANVVLVQGW